MSQHHRTIFGGFRQLGIMDEEAQRAIYTRATGQHRLSLMTVQQQKSVVDELRRLGYKPKPSAPPQQSFRQDGRDGKHRLSGKYLPKIRALWIALYNLGEVHDRRDSAMNTFAMGRQLPHLTDIRFAHTPGDGASVIEALKAWCARAGVFWADRNPCEPYEKSYGYKIARAQWAILHPSEPNAFWQSVTHIINQNIGYRSISDAEWITVMNHFGPQVRKRKPARKASAP